MQIATKKWIPNDDRSRAQKKSEEEMCTKWQLQNSRLERRYEDKRLLPEVYHPKDSKKYLPSSTRQISYGITPAPEQQT